MPHMNKGNAARKYYQVFLSSPTKNFKKTRENIIAALIREEQYFPVAMEYMTANSNTFQMLYNHMKNSDICVLLMDEIGGSKIENAAQYLTEEMKESLKDYMHAADIKNFQDITYTEFEYAVARYMGIPILAFINRKNVDKIASGDATIPAYRLYHEVRTHVAYSEIIVSSIISALNNYFKANPSAIGWIRETDSKIYNSAELAGITDISLDGFMSTERLRDLLKNATELNIMFTTGKTFFVSNSSLLTEFVANGGNIKFLCVQPNTDEMRKIQQIEEEAINNTRLAIHEELGIVVSEFTEILMRAKQQNKTDKPIGTIKIGFCNSLFRSSFILFLNNTTNKNYGWFTITLPPAKSRETVSFAIESSAEKNGANNLLNRSLQHFLSLWIFLQKNNNIFDVHDEISVNTLLRNESPKKYWEEKQNIAIETMKKRKRLKGILIEVAAQHPLKEGHLPAAEFSARLDIAAELYKKKTNEGFNVEIYVPGSIHLDFDGVPDDVSLSSAGIDYLLKKGVPLEALHGDDLNKRYTDNKFHKGVYNSADECFVASKYFFESNNSFSCCYSICSPNQAFRKTLLYLEFGIYPKILTVPLDHMFHNFIYELFEAVPYVVNEDHNYQAENSREALRTRKERMPRQQ